MLLSSAAGIDLTSWEDSFAGEATDLDMTKFADHLQDNNDGVPNAVIIDCTASDAVSWGDARSAQRATVQDAREGGARGCALDGGHVA